MKLAIVVGTRPEIIKLSSTIKLAKKLFDVTLIHTGQNYDFGLSQVFFDDLRLDGPDIYLNCDTTTVGSSVGSIISKSYDEFLRLQPDAVLILGDTNSCLCAYSAKRLKIPIFHLEAGNRAFDTDIPEEINRKIIDHISDLNICFTEHAKQNLLLEGISPRFLFVCGSPIPEICLTVEPQSSIPDVSDYILISIHREENLDNHDNFMSIVETIRNLSKKYRIIVSTHPRTRKKFDKYEIKFDNNVILSDPFGIIQYYALQKRALCVISDSGTVTEEAIAMMFPAILLRTSTERPDGIESGHIIICDPKNKDILAMVENLILGYYGTCRKINLEINFSEKICRIISGYTSIISRIIGAR